MRIFSLALVGAALVLSTPVAGFAQPSGAPQQSARSWPITLSGRYLAARVAEQDHDYADGADQLDAALARYPEDTELQYGAFRLRLYAGRIEAAAKLAPQVLTVRPGDGFANLVMAVEQIKRGDYKAAEKQIGRIGGENQLGPLRDYVIAWLKAGEKDFESARAAVAKLKPASGERAEAPSLIIAAEIEEMAGDKAAAEAKYRRAAELDPSGLRTILAAAGGLRRLGHRDDAEKMLKAYGEKFSDSVIVDGLIGPNAPVPKAPTAASGISDILFDIGGILSSDPRNQRADLALIFQELAVALKPDSDFAWLMIAGLYEQFQNTPKAVAALAKISPTSPLAWQARLRTAALDVQEDRLDQAITRLQALVAEKPGRIDAALTLADLLRSKERYSDSLKAYDTVIARLPKPEERHWVVFFGRGMVLERLKQWPRAEADMKRALELSPEQPYVLNYLGYSWVDQGVHLDEGMKMLKRASELRPDDGAISDSVGWAYYRLGQFDTAVEWLERAVEQKGDDATVSEHLGDVYWHVGRHREARFQWERALNLNPEKDRVPALTDKLANGLNASNDKPTIYEQANSDKKQGG